MASVEVKIPLALEMRGRPFFDINKDSHLSLKALIYIQSYLEISCLNNQSCRTFYLGFGFTGKLRVTNSVFLQ